MAHGPCLAPTVFFLREILRALCLTGIFNHFEIELGGQIKNRVHVGHLAVQMHGNHAVTGLPVRLWMARFAPESHLHSFSKYWRSFPGSMLRSARRCRQNQIGRRLDMASVVAINVFGTVTTISPERIPTAIPQTVRHPCRCRPPRRTVIHKTERSPVQIPAP